ncbi:MAG: NAD(P)H-dependent oxidoreductase subunit E, partial [Bacteroidales bacterium]|nr:NAD(P)H-dependent oxidoreductase subunit E [Bacteroidales bacterium]
MSNYKMHLLVCGGTGCRASESAKIAEELTAEIKNVGMENDAQVVITGCFGFCEKGPIVKVVPDNTFYTRVTPGDCKEIVEEHILKGRKVTRLLYEDPRSKEHVEDSKHMQFYQKQIRIALRNCGFIDPENIDEYIARDGYSALAKVLGEYTPQETIDIIKKSGLRGRGGGGFPTGLKWEIASKQKADQKYVVCNADEGDPGAFMDRSILEGDPHSIIEAMAICGYCIGATKGIVYIRAEYPLAINRLKVAARQCRAYGLLGKDIMGTGFDFELELRYGAGAFVCGEETALIHSMEGFRGEPTVKPPFPAEKGYLGKPTNVNNVETFANIPAIILKGAEWFSSIGTEKSKGTKVFALAGKINNVGLIEVPMGITLREVIYEIGGGIKGGKKFKAVQTGGPSGGCLTEKHLDVPIDYDNLIAAGSMMGSGGMIVMDEDDCMVAVAKFYLEFTVEESCGKCAPCRVGNKRLHENLEKICNGRGTIEDVEYLKNLG